METQLLKSIKDAIKHWYVPLLVGIFFVIVSIVVFSSPMTSLLTLSILFAISFLLGGIAEIVFSVTNRHQLDNWGWSLAFGIITLIAGLLLFMNPGLSVITLAFYVGFVVLFRSVAAISFSLDLKRYGSDNWGWLLAFGILGAIFSFILLWNPLFAGMGAVVLVALSFLFAGLFSILFALQLRKLHKASKELSPELRQRYEALAEDIRREQG
ncbi:HdeD family acid-resistance protein [Pricia sp. S334]|uniref:HdeD family acid-resistance protein n=1 Tax=Pricia mediterranea TaxID=3076079 RepID=A0ABU3L2A7_9FLAO|nr:HdeD family acid-resistance protein [Pricia sp. S334]MDT7827533.1 HdeD family acid-resistance protein [Pricia sp. S334]